MSEGQIAHHEEISVTCCQMRDWSPERIKKFFEGIAEMIRCVARIDFNNPELEARWAKVKKEKA